jgi:hypothetical protein
MSKTIFYVSSGLCRARSGNLGIPTAEVVRVKANIAGDRRLLGVLSATLSGPIRAQQATAPPPTGQSSIVLPATGLAAAPEELVEALDESKLPSTIPELLTELSKRADAIRQTIATGACAEVWVPAMAIKTVALVLEREAPSI